MTPTPAPSLPALSLAPLKLHVPRVRPMSVQASMPGKLPVGPATESEIRRLGLEKKNILLVPISFVSEHSETLYEIDYQYKILAEESGVRKFLRTQTVGIHPKFIGQMVEFCHQKNLVENFICPKL